MVFKATKENGGQRDPNISAVGRPKVDRKPLKREIKERELIALARKLKPHMAASIEAAVSIMKSDKSNDTNVLKAAAFLVSVYKQLINDVYDGEDVEGEESTPEVQPQQQKAPVFSLKMIED